MEDEESMALSVCMPTLSLIALLKMRFSKNNKHMAIYYDTLPRYLRAVRRLFSIRTESILAFLQKVIGLRIDAIPHGDEVPDYPNLHLESMQRTSIIADKLIVYLKNEPWILKLGQLIGYEPALAYSVKHVAHYYIFKHILPLLTLHSHLRGEEEIILVWDPIWPDTWYSPIRREIEEIPFNFFEWPLWFCLFYGIGSKFFVLLHLLLLTVRCFIRRGVVWRTEMQHSKIITEFVDPKRLNGTAYDADYWVDGDSIKPEDIVFFLTHDQRKRLETDGYRLNELKHFVASKGYRIAILDRLPYTCQFFKKLMLLYLQLVCSLKSLKNPVGLRIFGKCWIEVMEFSTLFENYRAKNCIYLTFPNGNTGFRLNDAVITGLCRTYNIRSVGCQTRTIYTTKYEDCFDCYDTYLTWGPAWHSAFPQRMQFVRGAVNIGCIYLDTLLPRYKQEKHINSTSCKQKDLMVSIFPSDIGDKHHYTGGYTIRFLISCARMAAKHSNMHFIVKMKDPALIDFVMMNPEFTCVFDSVKENFELPKLFRYDYTELIRLSHIVIAIGFTTPGAEALLLGKRAIYYSELTCGGQAFRHIPDLVATNQEEFENHFERALNDYQTYCSINRASIDPLDPFRDGRALQRIIASLNL